MQVLTYYTHYGELILATASQKLVWRAIQNINTRYGEQSLATASLTEKIPVSAELEFL